MENNSDSDYDPGKDDDDDVDNKSEVLSNFDNLSERSGNSPTKRKKVGTWKKNTKPNIHFFSIYQCSFCNYETHFRYVLKKHFKCCNQSSAKNRLKCPQCAEIFAEMTLLKKHNLSVSEDDQGNHVFHCPLCTLVSDNKSKTPILENYIQSKNLVCTDCHIPIVGFNELKRHIINTHSKTIQYRCEYCEYVSLVPSDLQKHKQCHRHLQKIGLIKCSHCTLDFFTIQDFKEHMKSIKTKNYKKDIKKGRITSIQDCTLLNDLEDNVLDADNKDNEDESKFEEEAWKLVCSLCQCVHDSEDSCSRHIKDKHRAEGYTAVTFFEYHGSVFEGSIVIGKHEESLATNVEIGNKRFKETNKELDNKINSIEFLNALNLTHAVNTLENDKENNEVITIQFASDSEDEGILGDDNINISFLEDEKIKQSKSDKITIVNNPIPESKKKVSDHKFVIDKHLKCTECSYKTKVKSYLLIHRQIAHEELIKGGFECTHKNCTYFTHRRGYFRNHLTKYHRNKLAMFYSKDLHCVDCDYVAKQPSHLLVHRKNKHIYPTLKSKIYKCPHCAFVTSSDYQLLQHVKKCKKAGTSLSNSKSTVVNCPHCGLTINKRSNFSKHLKMCEVKYNIRPKTTQEVNKNYLKIFNCRYCLKEHDKLYQLAWHIFMVHKNITDLQKWILKCEKCDYEHYSKVKCHEHGLQHKISFLAFQKFYQGIPKGKLRMRYLPNQFKDNLDDVIDTSSKKSTKTNTKKDLPIEKTNTFVNNNGEQCTSKAAIDILDWTHSDDDKNAKTYKNLVKSEIGKIKSTKEVLSDDDDLLKKKAEYFTCSQCSYETDCASHVPLHEKLIHAYRIGSHNAEFECPECVFTTKYRHNLKRHLMRTHQFDIAQLYNLNQEENPTSSTKKKNGHSDFPQCCQNYTNEYSRAWHVFKDHRDKTELRKWRIQCTLCSYSTNLKDQARQHAEAKHSSLEERVVVTFNTFYQNEMVGCFDFKIETDTSNIATKQNDSDVIFEKPEIIKIEITSDSDDDANQNKNLLQIEDQKSIPKFGNVNKSNTNQKNSNNKYVSINKTSLLKTAYVPTKNKLGDKYKLPENAVCKHCTNSFEDKYELAIHLYKAHSDKTELAKWAIKCMLCDFKSCWIRNASIHGRTRHGSNNRSTTAIFQIFYETEFEKVFPFHYKSQPYSCNKCDFLTATKKGIEKHKLRHNREINVSRVIKNETVPITKNQMESLDSTYEPPKTSNAVEDFVGKHFEASNKIKIKQNSKNSQINITVNENEIITIEIVPDKADISTEGGRLIGNNGLDLFSGECVKSQLINNKKVDGTLEDKLKISGFRCSKIDCKYSCSSLEKITEHIKFCTPKKPLKGHNMKVTCNLCQKVIPDGRFIQMHCNKHAVSLNNPSLVVSFSEFIGNRYICDMEVVAKLDPNPENPKTFKVKNTKTTFKCWMCGYLVMTKSTLRRHTQIHAREDGNPSLKVRYSKYRDDEMVATIIMHANPDYVFPKRPDRKGSPELKYNPDLEVFSCNECNFKTNQADALNKHKNLHWTPRKQALFKSHKWFTCSQCFFYCFDLDQFKKHGEWHKTHPKCTENFGKVGKDSWFLK